MLFTLALLLLLTPFPSLQTPVNEKKNSTGSDPAKPAVLTLLKPKTTAALAKPANTNSRPTPKPSAVNQTVLSTTAPAKTVLSTTVPPKTVLGTTVPPKTVLSTTVPPKTVMGTTVPPKTVLGTTVPPKTVLGTTVPPKTVLSSTVPAKPPTTSGQKTTKDKATPAPPPQPAKVVISAGYLLKDTQTDSGNRTQVLPGQELRLRPGSPLVMTHKISLEPGACTGGCVSEMAALKSRVARLEKEVSAIKDQCPCTKVSCPNDCSGHGKCEKGKCVCLSGFLGLDCSKCGPGIDCRKKGAKDKVQTTGETMTLKVTIESNIVKESTSTKDSTAKESTAKDSTAKESTAKESTAKESTAKVSTAKDSTAKESTSTKESTAKENTAKESTAIKEGTAKESTSTKGSRAKESIAKGSTAKESTAIKESIAKESTAKESTAKESTAKESTAKESTAIKESTAKESTAIKESTAKESTAIKESTAKESTAIKESTAKESTAIKESTAKESLQGKKAKVDQTLFQKKKEEEKKGAVGKEVDSKVKTKITTVVKAGLIKTMAKQGVIVTKTAGKGVARVNATKIGLGRPTVGQILLKHHGGRKQQEEARKGKTAVLTKKQPTPDLKVKVTVKDKALNATVTQSTVKGTDMSHPGKDMVEQSTLAEKNTTQTSGKKLIKKVDVIVTKVTTLSVNTTKIVTSKSGSGKGKVSQRSQYLVNVTTTVIPEVKTTTVDKTAVQVSINATRKAGGLGSIKVQDITTYGFTLTWTAPQAMFKNFTVTRREHGVEGEEEEVEEVEEGPLGGDDKGAAAGNATEILSESTNGTTSPAKAPVGAKAKPDSKLSKKVSMMLPGGVRSVEFSNLRSLTRYALSVYGTAPGKRSKIHRVIVTTGPEAPTDMVFSNVTESSITVSWSKPKSAFTGFKITYTHAVTGESSSVSVDSQQSHAVLSQLSAGSSYVITVISTLGRGMSDGLTAQMTTVPAPPTHLEAINITDTKAVVQWTPSLGKVDRFIISYESAKTPNVTVTVMVSGNSVEHQLRGLQRATLYTIKALSQKDSLQSTAIATTFTTASMVKASEVDARSAVIVWKVSTVVFHSYRVTYQLAGEDTKEVILDHSVTEYKLTGLYPMSKYWVLVQGERDGQYTSVVTTEFTTGKLRFPFPTECSQELLNGALQSGEVDIYPQGKEGGAVRVYCDMETEGGGWTVFQRRLNGKTDFYRSWSDYTNGFGNLSDEFWLGNELLHNLTSMGPVSLRVDLRAGNDTAYAHYSNFTIESEARHYAIEVSGFTGTAGDSMRYHNGRPFSTKDKDPNPLGIHCARAYMGGWWYKNCYKTNLNGLYGVNSNNQGVVWIDWKGKDSSIPFTEMKFRPAGFSPATHG